MKTIGIIGAMPSELADIRNALGEALIEKAAGYEFYINEMNGKRIVNVCCGIGKVNAALCAQNLIDKYQADCILNAGIAGGMNPEVKVCDIVVADNVLYHDLTLRFLENYPPYKSCYECAPALIKKAVAACAVCGTKSFVGRIVSGEAFISDAEVKARIQNEFSPHAVDMESAGIGHCAYRNGIPFVSIRCISDNADDEGEMSFDQFEKIAAREVADVVFEMIRSME